MHKKYNFEVQLAHAGWFWIQIFFIYSYMNNITGIWKQSQFSSSNLCTNVKEREKDKFVKKKTGYTIDHSKPCLDILTIFLVNVPVTCMKVNFEVVSLYQQLYVNPEWMNRNPTYNFLHIYFDEFKHTKFIKIVNFISPPPQHHILIMNL